MGHTMHYEDFSLGLMQMRRAAMVVFAALALVALTGCGETVEDVKKEAAFIDACHATEGKFVYGLFGQQCSHTQN